MDPPPELKDELTAKFGEYLFDVPSFRADDKKDREILLVILEKYQQWPGSSSIEECPQTPQTCIARKKSVW